MTLTIRSRRISLEKRAHEGESAPRPFKSIRLVPLRISSTSPLSNILDKSKPAVTDDPTASNADALRSVDSNL